MFYWFIGRSPRPEDAGTDRLTGYDTRERRAARGGGGGGGGAAVIGIERPVIQDGDRTNLSRCVCRPMNLENRRSKNC
jgi:hypothetical protein